MKDKREHQRIQLLRKVMVTLKDGEQVLLDVLDYSMGGISVLSKKEFMIGEQLKLESLTTLDGEDKPLGLIGEVKHIRLSEQGYVVGMMFKEK